MKPISPILKEEKIGLANFIASTHKLFFKWLNDPEFCRFLGDSNFSSYSQKEAKKHVKSIKNGSLLIVIKKKGVWLPIGYIRLNLRPRHLIANLTIAIGEKNLRGKGYGKKAMALTLRYAFEKLNLFAVYLVVSKNNEPAIAVYKKIGFKKCGVRHGARMEEGRRFDEIMMEYNKNMYYKKKQL